jgi:hypothetical protein
VTVEVARVQGEARLTVVGSERESRIMCL